LKEAQAGWPLDGLYLPLLPASHSKGDVNFRINQ